MWKELEPGKSTRRVEGVLLSPSEIAMLNIKDFLSCQDLRIQPAPLEDNSLLFQIHVARVALIKQFVKLANSNEYMFTLKSDGRRIKEEMEAIKNMGPEYAQAFPESEKLFHAFRNSMFEEMKGDNPGRINARVAKELRAFQRIEIPKITGNIAGY